MAKDLFDVFDEFDSKKKDKVPEKEEEKQEKDEEKVEESQPKEEKKVEKKKTPPSPPPKSEFDFSPAEKLSKHTITIYGLKGSGKTYLTLSTPGSHFCLTFDNKSQSIADELEADGKVKEGQIEVHDGVKYYDRTSGDNWLKSSDYSWRYINALLDKIKLEQKDDDSQGRFIERPDWIEVDGGEIVHTMLEMVMRERNNLMPFQGISNRNVWEERRMYIETLLHRCQKIARKGVIWTSYIDKDEIKEDGDYVSIQDIPKWIDAVLYETDVLVKAERKTGKAGQEFYATVESSKWRAIPESGRINVTGRGFAPLIKDKKLFDK